ncbi:phage terminase small subunit P27 family [Tetragenococcus halophilus]|uniref:phage terminase small subunit P27 family n=2 Tax=Tetragenococcus halophilus TaxID=51669 RepID=UPI001B603BBC|nr:phage terminase small subunit P27 family [Tetragenococcus halophilus]GFK22836.1 phage-related terminase-small subunit [Tetragenococcus halophilus]GLL52232.1 terminase [Tetragenococcus halophilus]
MANINLLKDDKQKTSNEVNAQRQDALEELFNYEDFSMTNPPAYFPQAAQDEWERLLPILKNDFPLSETDYGNLVAYCLAFARMKQAEHEIKKYGTFQKNKDGSKRENPAVRTQSRAMHDLKAASTALGMTMVERQKMALNKAKAEPEKDPFAELMNDE